jgi:drug/metabolite transporter (DMT)-like permease
MPAAPAAAHPLQARSAPPRAKLLAAFAAIYLIFGSTFLALRYAVAVIPPLLTIALRCLLAAAVLYAVLAWRERGTTNGERTTIAHWRTALLSGMLLFVGGHGLLAWSAQHAPSGYAALIQSTGAVWLVLVSAARERQRPHGLVLAGLAAGLAGVALLTRVEQGGTAVLRAIDVAALLASSLLWTIGAFVGRDGGRAPSLLRATAMQLAMGGVATLVASGLAGELAAWSPATLAAPAGLRAVAGLAYLAFVGSVIGFGSYTWLLTVSTAARVGTASFVNPVVALFLGWLVAGEVLTGWTFAGAGLILGSLALIGRGSGAAREQGEAVGHEAGGRRAA